MDLLNRKRVLMTVCLLGAFGLSADEHQSEETPQEPEQETQKVLEPMSTETSDQDQSSPEPIQSTTQTSQSTELKPLFLTERIRAHANIDLPQDI